eukprot:4908168-Karenia_brevis.AAC.1
MGGPLGKISSGENTANQISHQIAKIYFGRKACCPAIGVVGGLRQEAGLDKKHTGAHNPPPRHQGETQECGKEPAYATLRAMAQPRQLPWTE